MQLTATHVHNRPIVQILYYTPPPLHCTVRLKCNPKLVRNSVYPFPVVWETHIFFERLLQLKRNQKLYIESVIYSFVCVYMYNRKIPNENINTWISLFISWVYMALLKYAYQSCFGHPCCSSCINEWFTALIDGIALLLDFAFMHSFSNFVHLAEH